MILAIVSELGAWTWWVLGLGMLILEIMLPGVFMLWFGIAAILVGTIGLMMGEASFWTWQVQFIVFAALSLVSVIVGRKYWYDIHPDSDQPDLNERGTQMVGRVSVLLEGLENGTGRIKLGDTVWRVVGPDLPAGSKVKVIASDANKLIVEAA